MTGVVDAKFWCGRRVLLTGHTGFKGAWTALWLTRLGADVLGLALPPDTDPSLFDALGSLPGLESRFADIRDAESVAKLVEAYAPEIVIHMAAQALVFRSYREPRATFATNVLGTANLLEAIRAISSVQAVLVVTSDKVYRNQEDGRALTEASPLGGDDPYSASKVATEIAAASWSSSYFVPRGIPVVTARAGNVIGGGDWAENRLVPDIWRAVRADVGLTLRSPDATRPWQHVLDCIAGYLVYLQAVAEQPAGRLPHALNFGPPLGHGIKVTQIAEAFLLSLGRSPQWNHGTIPQIPEKRLLQLDPGLAAKVLGWRTRLDFEKTLSWTAEWYRAFDRGANMREVSGAQIAAYQEILAS